MATIGAHVARPAGRTLTLARARITFAIVLALALRLAFVAMLAVRTPFRAQRAHEARRTMALARNVMAFAAVRTLTPLRTIRTVVMGVRALGLAAIAFVASGAQAFAVELVAGAVVHAVAFVRTISAPKVFRAS